MGEGLIDADAEVAADPAGAVAGGAPGFAPARVDAGVGEAADRGEAGADDRGADRGDVILEVSARRGDGEAAAALGVEPAGAAPARRAGGIDDAAGRARLGFGPGRAEGDAGDGGEDRGSKGEDGA